MIFFIVAKGGKTAKDRSVLSLKRITSLIVAHVSTLFEVALACYLLSCGVWERLPFVGATILQPRYLLGK